MGGTGLEVPIPKQLCARLAENVSCIITLRDNGIRSQQQWRQLMATEILCAELCNTPPGELRLWHHTYSFQNNHHNRAELVVELVELYGVPTRKTGALT